MRARFLVTPTVAVLALVSPVRLGAQHLESRTAVGRARAAPQTTTLDAAKGAVRAAVAVADTGRGLPHWVRWGLVGAAAGAVTFPILNGVSSDSEKSSARAAGEGAVIGFAVIGGSVALWDAVCRGDTKSRRAGLCGGRRGAAGAAP